jgi:2-octaprenyl-6-methoxyphenol hydroxylase
MHCHLAIIGGGMVGASLAVSLRQTNLQIALIDAAPLHSPEDSRLIALNHSSICFFESIGVWSELKAYAAPMEQIHVSHRGHFGITRIDCKELNVPALGYVVPAKYINAVLSTALADMRNIKIIQPAKLQALEQTESGVILDITGDVATHTLTADRVIGADGSFSTVRELLGIDTEKVDYQQSALVTTTVLQREHNNVAYERFQAEGAIAMLPLVGKQAATIWTASNETIAKLLALTDAEYLQQLQTSFGYRLGRFLGIEKRAVYPLQMLRAKQQSKQSVLLVGNAAHTFHPIAAQGLNLALYEVASVTKFLQGAEHGKSWPDFTRESLQGAFSKNLSHHLTWIFSSDYFMFNILRQVGMLSLDVLPGLKQRFAWQAMGKSRRL